MMSVINVILNTVIEVIKLINKIKIYNDVSILDLLIGFLILYALTRLFLNREYNIGGKKNADK